MNLKERLRKGETVFGTFVKINSPAILEILNWGGFDFAVIDCEHSVFSPLDVENLIRTGTSGSLDIIVRVASPTEEHILHSLDSGATGVQLPGLQSYEELVKAVSYTKYFPNGSRGLSFTHRAARYGLMDKNSYLKIANNDTLTIVHIENQEMSEQVEKICDLPSIDVVFIGPVDLSQSLGKPGNTKDPSVVGAIDKVLTVCKQKNKISGIFVNSTDEVQHYKEMGARYMLWSTDVGIFVGGVKQAIQQLQSYKVS